MSERGSPLGWAMSGHLIDRHGASEWIHAAARRWSGGRSRRLRGSTPKSRLPRGRAPGGLKPTWPATHPRRGRRCRRWPSLGTRRGAQSRRCYADDGAGEPVCSPRRRRRGRRPQTARRGSGRWLLIHQHRALELRSGCPSQVEAALDTCRCGLCVLRPTVRTEHAPPPSAPPGLERARSRAPHTPHLRSARRVLCSRPFSQAKDPNRVELPLDVAASDLSRRLRAP